MDKNLIYNIKKSIINKKIVITLVAFFVWVALFDSSSMLHKKSLNKKLEKLKKEQRYYRNKITEDSLNLIELQTDNESLEKIAREKFLMKKENEDIFIVKKSK